MSPPEFGAWRAFYELFPFDDLHRFHRPAALVAAAWGGKYQERIEFLSPKPVVEDQQPANQGRYSSTDLQMINAFTAMARGK